MTVPSTVDPRDVQFVMVVERGDLERQALMLAESIRLLAGGWGQAQICAVSPRAACRPGSATVEQLQQLDVRYLTLDVSSPCPEYGTSWRMAALAEIESMPGPEVLVMLDSDALFFAPPHFALPEGAVALRPVDVKGICSAGPDDPLDDYWRRLSSVCGVDYDSVPWVETTVGGERVKASHNGGLVIAARRNGLFARAFEFLVRACRDDVAPRARRGGSFRIGSGVATGDATRLWGSAQTVLTMAMVSLGLEQHLLPPTYNVPLHTIDPVLLRFPNVRTDAVHVHYHWLCNGDSRDNPMLDGRIVPPEPVQHLLARHLGLAIACAGTT